MIGSDVKNNEYQTTKLLLYLDGKDQAGVHIWHDCLRSCVRSSDDLGAQDLGGGE